MINNKSIWFDFTNPPHVNFFKPILNHFNSQGYEIVSTARDFAETIELLKSNHIAFYKIGKHRGKKKINKIIGLLEREIKLLYKMRKFDISISSNYESPLISWIKRKKSIVFDDNEISPNWLYSKFATYVVSPAAIDKKAMYNMGIKPDQLITYDGFKEDIYIADYIPDTEFLNQIPFTDFITIRPENIYASYVPSGIRSIVPALLKLLTKNGYNILYLPRYEIDKTYASSSENIFIPNRTLNGLDVCYYSNAVLTGAGTFAREAAVIGKPAVSFFAGSAFLGVDKKMFESGMVYYSRQPEEILSYLKNDSKMIRPKRNSKLIQKKFYSILDKLIYS